MSSLQDALLKSGLVDADKLKQTRKKKTAPGSRSGAGRGKPQAAGNSNDRGRPARKKKQARKKNAHGDSSLANAYAARRKAEQAEKERAKQARVADQEARRKRNLELDNIAEGKALNADEADQPRYFEHIGRIRRVLCTPEQRDRINSGELGIVSLRGRYLIVDPETLEKYRAVAPDLVPDLSGKEPEHMEEGDYPPVPDDITW